MDSKGQVNVVTMLMVMGLTGVICILIFYTVYTSLNLSVVPANVVTILGVVGLVLAAVLVVGIISGLGFIGRGR